MVLLGSTNSRQFDLTYIEIKKQISLSIILTWSLWFICVLFSMPWDFWLLGGVNKSGMWEVGVYKIDRRIYFITEFLSSELNT